MTSKNIQVKPSQTLLTSFDHLASYNNILNSLSSAKPALTQHIVSDKNKPIMRAIEALKTKPPLTAHKSSFISDGPIDELLFDARAKVKIMTSAVSMHMNHGLREKLFRQIDMLHDPDEWESDDIPISESSFKSFLAGFLQINPERGPGLGLSYAGNLIASWVFGGDRLIIEFMPNNVKWVITRFIDGEPEQFTGHTKITRLYESLAPYEPERWFTKEV